MPSTVAPMTAHPPATLRDDVGPRERHRVVVCIPTCQRPQNLASLLASIEALDRTGIELHAVVVDNDAGRSAEPVVRAAMARSAIPLRYDCVAERNLPVVRNRLVELASMLRPDWIWFLDDDQLVEPDALRLMLSTAEASGADCIVARVPHTFEGSTSRWAHWSHLFDEVARPTGKPTRGFGTNGPLLRFGAVAQMGQPFDPRLRFAGGHHGGEDSHFFTRFHARGFRSVGCNEAVIHDRLHATRNTPRWLTQRALRIGLVKGFLVREIEPSLLKTARWLTLGGGYLAVNLLLALATLPWGPSRFFRYWIRAVQGYGVVLGVITGRRFLRGKEQAHVHGA